MVSPAVIVEGWEFFLPESNCPLTFLLERSQWKSHKGTLEPCELQIRAHPWLMLLGVRLNIEVGGFPAVRALAACWNTQLKLTYTDTSLRPHTNLCVHQPNDAKRYDYHHVYTSFPLAFSYISINSHRHWGYSSVHVWWHVINSMIIKISMWMA